MAACIVDESTKFGLDYRLTAAVCRAESNFNQSIINSKFCYGIMQIRPVDNFGQDVWLSTLRKEGIIKEPEDLLTMERNIHAGAFILSYYLRRYSNHYLALSAYSGNPSGNIDYFEKVMIHMARI